MSDGTGGGRSPVAIAAEILGGVSVRDPRVVSGQFHDVVLVPGDAAVRIARHPGAASELARSAALLHRLVDMDLPFEVPRPLGPVREVDGRAVLAVSWVEGSPSPRGVGDPVELRGLLAALAAVNLSAVEDLLARPHAYAGGDEWYRLMIEEVLPRLPPRWSSEAHRRIEEAAALPEVSPSLVHGDLAGDNMRWDDAGRLVGVLDWDLASAWDPAVDVACLSWHGWETVHGEPPDVVDQYVDSTVAWLERTSTSRGDSACESR